MDLDSNSGLCLRAEAPPDLGRLLESGPALRTVWTVAVWTPDPGETHQAKLGEAGQGLVTPGSKIQNPGSGTVRCDIGSKILDPESMARAAGRRVEI